MWNLKDLLDYLESSVFEPMEEKSLETCRDKALIPLLLATGRRLEDIEGRGNFGTGAILGQAGQF